MKHLEQQEAEALFRWVQLNEAAFPALKLFFAVPNGGARPKKHGFSPEAVRMKKSGVRAGVSDYILLSARGGFNGLVLELKAGKNKPTKAQKEFLDRAAAAGYKAAWCSGWDTARRIIEEYLYLDENHAIS